MKNLQLKNSTLVVFGKEFPTKHISRGKFGTIVADKIFQKDIEILGFDFIDINTLVGPGNVKEASTFAEELSRLRLSNGSRITKSFLYKGYELWWIHYGSLFLYFCLPYTQYKKLLEYLKSFKKVSLYRPPHNKNLFYSYLNAHGREVATLREPDFKSSAAFPFGVFLQIIVTILSIPILILRKPCTMLFIGDKFEKNKDYDFRTGLIYKELRQKKLSFVEFIRSLESWKIVLKHVIKRKRPVIYSEGIAFVGRFISVISGGHRRALKRFGAHNFAYEKDTELRFKLFIANQYLLTVYDDVWAIRIMKLILRLIGVKAAIITAANERNFHTVLGCKLNNIPIVGILHGVSSCYATPYDFMSGFNGAKMLSVDKYGLWSEWWREYYIKNSRAYKPEQLYVSGPMRPLEVPKESDILDKSQNKIPKVLFISEQTAVPSEVIPYLEKLLNQKDIELTIKFRPYKDRFEDWLLENEPQILKSENLQIIKGGMQEAIQNTDVVVGFRSTGVLEALLQAKVPIFLRSQKWGDFYNITELNEGAKFFAENPDELIEKIKNMNTISYEAIISLSNQYFGDPYKNGSKWVVDEIERELRK